MKLRRTVVLGAAGLVVVGIGTAIYFSRTKWVPAGHVGVIFSASGGLQKEVISPRRVFVPWMSQLYLYPTMLKSAIYTNQPGQGEIKAADAIQVTTNDNANTPFDVVVWYSVLPENVHTVFNSFRAIPIEEIQSQHIRGAVRQAVNNVGTKYDAFQLMGPKRGEASDLLKGELVKILDRKGITIHKAEFAGASPSKELQARITSRVNSLTELKISQSRQDIAKISRDTALIKAGAQAKAQQIASSQTKDRSLDLLRLEADEAALEKWNGRLPPIQVRPGQTIIVTPDVLSTMGRGADK